MIVLVQKRDGSSQWCMTEVERIAETDDLDVVLVTPHSEDVVVDLSTERIDIVGVG